MTYPPQQPLQYDPRYANAPAYQPQPPMYPGNNGTQQQPYQPTAYGQQPAAPLPTSAQGGQTLPTQAPTLGQSGRTGGASAPAPRHLLGRTVIFEPIKIDDTTTVQVKDPQTKQMVTVNRPTAHYHLTVVDGGPLQYGDNQDDDETKRHGMTFEVDTPCRFVGLTSDRFGIVNEVRDAMARGDQGSVGVIVRGTQGGKPFLVTKPGRDLDGKDRPDGDQRFAAAMAVWTKIWAKDLSWNPTPRSLVAPPAQQPAQVAYQPTAPQQGATYGTAGGAPQYVTPMPQQFAAYAPAGAQQQYPTPGAAGGYDPQAFAGFAPAPAQQPAMDPGYAAYLAAQQAQRQPAPAPQSAPPVDPQYAAWLASQQAQTPQGGPGI